MILLYVEFRVEPLHHHNFSLYNKIKLGKIRMLLSSLDAIIILLKHMILIYFGHSTADSKREVKQKNRRLEKSNITNIKIWMITKAVIIPTHVVLLLDCRQVFDKFSLIKRRHGTSCILRHKLGTRCY